MSAKVSGKVWDLDLPHNKLLVLLALADHADHDGNNVFPSLGLVAWKTGYGEQQCRRVMKELEKDGLLVAMSRVAGHKTIYRIEVSKGTQKEAYVPSKKIPLTKSNPLHSDTDPLHFDPPTPNMPSLENSQNRIEPSIETKQPRVRASRKPEPFYDAISEVFKITASGQVVSIRAMMQGNAKRGTWKDCNFEPPVTNPSEITAFGVYMASRMSEMNITQPISAAVTIQRWFYDFRMMEARKANRIEGDYIPVNERTSALDGIQLS